MVKLGLIFLAHTIGVNDWIASVKMVTSIRATKSTIRTSARRWTIFSMQSNFCCVSCKYCPTQTYANSHHRQSVQYFYYSSLPDSTTNKEFDNWFSICEKKKHTQSKVTQSFDSHHWFKYKACEKWGFCWGLTRSSGTAWPIRYTHKHGMLVFSIAIFVPRGTRYILDWFENKYVSRIFLSFFFGFLIWKKLVIHLLSPAKFDQLEFCFL